jgi:hypothetical protein
LFVIIDQTKSTFVFSWSITAALTSDDLLLKIVPNIRDLVETRFNDRLVITEFLLPAQVEGDEDLQKLLNEVSNIIETLVNFLSLFFS